MQLPDRFAAKSNWAFVPGPANQFQELSSLEVQEIVELAAATVAETFLSFPGMRLTHPPEPNRWAWRAQWKSTTEFIELKFTLLQDSGENWGGSQIIADCSFSTLLSLFEPVSRRHAGIWLHDPECGMHAYQHISKAA